MIQVFVNVNEEWKELKISENFSLVTEVGGRVPEFSFQVYDDRFKFSPFHSTDYSDYFKKGNQVRILNNDIRIATGYINNTEFVYPSGAITVKCRGVLSKLENDYFGGEDWSYESGNFSQVIPAERYVSLPFNVTAVWDVRLDNEFFFSYEWDFNNKRVVITDDTASGIISGKYLTSLSPHLFLAHLLSGVDFACVPLINGTYNYNFSLSNLLSGASEGITRIIDLGAYTTGWGTITFNDATVNMRFGNTMAETKEQEWQGVSNNDDLSVFGFHRYIQFDIDYGEGFNGITINLTGNAPNVERVVFRSDMSRMNALNKLVECYKCYIWEDPNGVLRIEHREAQEDYSLEVAYGNFTDLKTIVENYPQKIVVIGLTQSFQSYGSVNGAKRIYKGTVEFEGDLAGEQDINNGIAWESSLVENIALLHSPVPSKVNLTTSVNCSLGDYVKVVTTYLENKDYVFIPYKDSPSNRVYVDDVSSSTMFYQIIILAYSASIYRVMAKIFQDSVLWDYECEEVYRFPSIFEDLYEYIEWQGWNWQDVYPTWDDFLDSGEFVVPDMDVDFEIWDGNEWVERDLNVNPETGEVIPPDDVIWEIPTEPPPGGDEIPPSPIVYGKRKNNISDKDIGRIKVVWDIWDCSLSLDDDGWEFIGGLTLLIADAKEKVVSMPGLVIDVSSYVDRLRDATVDNDGNIYVLQNYPTSKIIKFNSEGEYVSGVVLGNFDDDMISASGIEFHSGILYVPNYANYEIKRFNTSLIELTSISVEDQPASIAFDGIYEYITTGYDGTVIKMQSGIKISSWSVEDSFPDGGDYCFGAKGIAYYNGYLYVAHTYRQKILKYSTTGTLIKSWGTKGMEEGQLRFPFSVAVTEDMVYVGDIGRGRIVVFDLDGNFQREVGQSYPIAIKKVAI